jgi:hypothetical protein
VHPLEFFDHGRARETREQTDDRGCWPQPEAQAQTAFAGWRKNAGTLQKKNEQILPETGDGNSGQGSVVPR